MAPTEQKALILPSKGADFFIDTIPVPKPGPGQILIKVQSASLNPVDWHMQQHGFLVNQFPAIIGGDIAGDVEEVGEGVTNVIVGDRVFVQALFSNEAASYQQYALVPSDFVAKIPANLTYDDASTLPIALATAYLGFFNENPHGLGIPNPLVDNNRVSPNQPIIILAGASSVGQFAIQFARLVGFSYIITTASPKHTDFLKSLGATHVIDRNIAAEVLPANISAIIGDRPVTHVFDAASTQETQQAGYDLLSSDGRIAIVLPDVIKTKVEAKFVNHVYGHAYMPQNRKAAAVLFKAVTKLLEEGTINPTRLEILPAGLAGVPKGIERLVNNQVSGVKLVARPQETD